MADGAYERRMGREAELKRISRILRENVAKRTSQADSSILGEVHNKKENDEVQYSFFHRGGRIWYTIKQNFKQ